MGTYIHTREEVVQFLKNAKKELDENYDALLKANFEDDVSCRLVVREANSVFSLSKRLVLGEFKGGEGD